MATGLEGSECGCGKPRPSRRLRLAMERGALRELPDIVRELAGAKAARCLAVFDATTHRLFGGRVLGALESGGVEARALVLGDEDRPFEPDEAAVRAADAAVAGAADSAASGGGRLVLAGVGSGAVNDLCKHVAATWDLPYVSVATAPSMDGFAAPISALILGKVKTTVPSTAPDAVVADLDILAGAPLALITAGLGDVLGKLTSLADWRMAHVLFDEYWCRETAEEVDAVARRAMASASLVSQRSPGAVGDLMDALVRAGSSVVHVGSSRPTSGAEHLVSHFVEMWHANRGLRPPAHGHAVAVGTLIASRTAEALRGLRALPAPVAEDASPADVLGALKIGAVPGNFGLSKFDEEARRARRKEIAARWDLVLEALSRFPAPEEVARALRRAGCPTRLSDLGVGGEAAVQAIAWSRFLRERYTVFDLAADAGVFPELVQELVAEYA